MKHILAIVLLTFATAIAAHAAPWRLVAEHSTLAHSDGAIAANVIAVTWATQPDAPQAYEVQRKLFPWGWRKMAVVRSDSNMWMDRRPAKRTAWYRVRALYETRVSKWSASARVE